MASGNAVWATEFGPGSQLAVSSAVAIDGAGDVIVGGTFGQPIDFGGGQLTNTGPFVAMFGPTGAYQWAKAFNSQGGAGAVTSIAVDGTGVVAAGWFTGTINLGGGAIQDAGVADEIFVVRYDPSGNYIWGNTFGDGTNAASLGSMALDGSGDLVLAGTFSTSLTLGGTTLMATGPSQTGDAGTTLSGDFVLELDALTGNQVWSVAEPPTDNILVGVDGNGDVFLTGAFDGSIDFGGATLTSVGGYDVAVAELDPMGGFLWSQSFGSPGNDSVSGLAVDSSGDVVFFGLSGGSIALGGTSLAGAFLAKLDGSGNYVWSNVLGGVAIVKSMVADGTHILAAGVASRDITLGDGQLGPNGPGNDLLVMKLDGSGNWIWGLRAGESGGAGAHQIAVNSSHYSAVAGSAGAGNMSIGSDALTCGTGMCALVAELGP